LLVDSRLNQTEAKMDELSRQRTLLRHEYRSSRDDALKTEIMKKWDELQKKMETLEKKRQKTIEEKNEIEFKSRWKGWDKISSNYWELPTSEMIS
jgi:flagellar biosynthesis/type III secretory pathway chaperone